MEGSSKEQDGDSLANDWRTQHEPDLRAKVIYAIMGKLKICDPTQSKNYIKKTAIEYEDGIYGIAKDKDDYLRRINRVVVKCDRTFGIVSSDNGAHTTPEAQGQSLPTSLPYTQTLTSQQWLPPSNLNVPESSGLAITVSAPENLNIQMSEEGVHSNLLPGPQREIQGRQQLLQQPQQSSNTMFQHHMDQQLPYMQLSQPMMLQQYQPNNPVQQQQPHDRILQKHLDDTQRFEAAGSLHQSQNLADQQNQPYQLEGAHLENPSSTSGGDWREETYQKIKALKEKYSHVLSTLLQTFSDKVRESDSLPQQNMPDVSVQWFKGSKEKLELVLVFLNVCKSSVSECHRDRFSLYERRVLRFAEYHQTLTQRAMQRQQQMYQQPQMNHQQFQRPENEMNEMRIRQRVNSKDEFEFQQHLSSSQHQHPQREIQGRQQLLRQPQQQQESSHTMFEHHMDQQQNQPYQLEGANPSSTSGNDWREETYQKIKALKEKYSLVLSTLLQEFSDKVREIDSLPQQNMPNVPAEKIRKAKATLEMFLVSLNVSRNSISEKHRDRFSVFEEYVVKFIKFHQREMQQQQVHHPPSQIHQTALQSQSGQEHVSQSLESDQMSSRLMPSHQNGSSSMPNNANQIQTSSQEHPLVTQPPERPIDRLIRAIQSSSPENLAQSVSEMSSVISLADMLSGSDHSIGGSRAHLGEDLSERTRFHLLQGDTNPTSRFNRSVTAIPLDSTASSGSKVNKIEPGCALLQELNEINKRLVETVVSICNEDVGPSEITSGTVVKCSYVPVALSATFKALYNSGHVSQIQPLLLLVPENYPCSPILLEKGLLFDGDSVHKYEDLSGRARWRFVLSMKEYSEAMSLKEIAQVWDECARATMAEYGERHGGGTFSSKYGRWESVLRSP